MYAFEQEMARLSFRTRRRRLMRLFLHEVMTIIIWFFITVCTLIADYERDRPHIRYSLSNMDRAAILHRYAYESDNMCISQLRMNMGCFKKLCNMLGTLGGLRASRNMGIDEQVAIFLHIMAHNVKVRVITCRFHRSGETISRLFTRVCNAVIRLHSHLLKKPEPIREDSTDGRWKWFKNCLGALDGTYIRCLVPLEDKARYRTRKNDIATNVLGVCSQDMQFIYVLPGWEGSAADGRVLRDAILRPHGLKLPRPYFYLVDAGYTNGEGFLAPYRGQRYHLNDWRDGYQPTTPKELFNMRHSSARNIIERCFGILKARWGILKDNSYYHAELKNKIIMACCLLHNHIRREMPNDPFENDGLDETTEDDGDEDVDNVSSVGTSTEWTAFRNNLAQHMFEAWNATH